MSFQSVRSDASRLNRVAASTAVSRHGRRHAIVAVSSFNKEDRTVSVAPDAKPLGLAAGFKAFDLETGKPLAVEGGAGRVKLPRLDYVMIELRK